MPSVRTIGVSAFLRFTANKAIGQMRKAGRSFDGLANSAKRSKSVLQGFRAGFHKLSLIGAGAAVGIGLSIKAFADFDAATAALKSRLDNPKEIKKFTSEALRLGKMTKFTGAEILGAMEGLRKFGRSSKQIMQDIVPVTQLATNENLSLADAAEKVLSAQKALGGQISAPKTLDLLSFVAGNSAATVGRLVEGLKLAGPASQLLGSSARDTVGILGLLNSAAMFGSRAGTALASSMSKMAKNAKGGTIQIGAFTAKIEENVKGGVDVKQTFLNIATALKRIQEINPGVLGKVKATKAAQKIFGMRGGRGIGSFLKFVKGKDADTLKKIFLSPQSAIDGFAKRLFKIRQQNIRMEFTKLTSAINTLGVSLVTNFSPQITMILQKTTKVIGDLATAFEFFLKDGKNTSKSISSIMKALGGKVSKGTVEFVRDFVIGLKGVWTGAKIAVVFVKELFAAVGDLAGAFGISRSSVIKFTAAIVGFGAVVLAAKVGLIAFTFAGKPALFMLGLLKLGFNSWSLSVMAAMAPLLIMIATIGLAVAALVRMHNEIKKLGGYKRAAKDIGDFFAGGVRAHGGGMARKKGFAQRSAASFAVENLRNILQAGKTRTARGAGGKRVAITRELAVKRARAALVRKGVTSRQEQDKILKSLDSTLKQIPLAASKQGQQAVKEAADKNKQINLTVKLGKKTVAAATVQTQKENKDRGLPSGRSNRKAALGGT